jgi:hypothetical protein
VREAHRITARRREPGTLQVIHGQRHHLQRRAVAAGMVDLSDARVRWWVLDGDDRGRTAEALQGNSSGHAAALLDDELYEVLPKTRGGYQRVQEFGVRFGYDRVMLYLEPFADHRDRLESNTARTLLLIDNAPLPWGRWAEEFRAAMPADIQRLQERVAGRHGRHGASREHTRAPARARVPLSPQPVPAIARTAPVAAVRRHRRPGPIAEDRSRSLARRRTARASCGRRPRSGCARRPVGPAQRRPARYPTPDVTWVSVRDGTRAPGELEDRAARYHRDRNQLTVNADFRVFTDMVARWTLPYRGMPGARPAVEALVREWFEQTLIESVLSARTLEGSPHWSSEQIDELVSEPALVSACLPRQLLDAAVHKRLAQRLGREAVRQRP